MSKYYQVTSESYINTNHSRQVDLLRVWGNFATKRLVNCHPSQLQILWSSSQESVFHQDCNPTQSSIPFWLEDSQASFIKNSLGECKVHSPNKKLDVRKESPRVGCELFS